jgi:NTE family protein
VRRGVPNHFPSMPRTLRIIAHDLDSGELVVFGGANFTHVPVTRACSASMALPPIFSPVRIGARHYVDAGAAQVSHLDVADQGGADVIVIINPLVPVYAENVPTGHGRRDSVRDKGAVWVMNQSIRIGTHALMRQACARLSQHAAIILIEPQPTDAILFMHSPASFGARRTILEYAYRTTRARLIEWLEAGDPALARAGWRLSPLAMGNGQTEAQSGT